MERFVVNSGICSRSVFYVVGSCFALGALANSQKEYPKAWTQHASSYTFDNVEPGLDFVPAHGTPARAAHIALRHVAAKDAEGLAGLLAPETKQHASAFAGAIRDTQSIGMRPTGRASGG